MSYVQSDTDESAERVPIILGTGTDSAAEPKEDVSTAMVWTVFGLLFACGVGTAFFMLVGEEACMQFWTGYMLEMCLSLDNLFAFYIVFRYFKLKNGIAQARVLRWGIAGSIVLRAMMVGAGAAALTTWRPLLLGCAVMLVISSIQMFMEEDGDDEDEDLSDNSVVKLARAITPVSGEFHGSDFFVNGQNGFEATPLMLVLVTIEFSDVVFAVDSVPAIFGITSDVMVVWAACMCAVLCLRSLYSLVVQAVTELAYMNKGIAVVLMFIAGKIAAEVLGNIDTPVWVTLGVVFVVLGISAIASVHARNASSPNVDDLAL